MIKKKPSRMCISCRQKIIRITMVRLQQKEQSILTYQGKGRSFYLCNKCINDEKKIRRLSKRFKEDFIRFNQFLKELVENG
ncbi:MAG: DUF448 domain-containing protein [Sulfurovum sp.]|nr:DUF448 domain-containing protein [Sulfurovaceae bacterium]